MSLAIVASFVPLTGTSAQLTASSRFSAIEVQNTFQALTDPEPTVESDSRSTDGLELFNEMLVLGGAAALQNSQVLDRGSVFLLTAQADQAPTEFGSSFASSKHRVTFSLAVPAQGTLVGTSELMELGFNRARAAISLVGPNVDYSYMAVGGSEAFSYTNLLRPGTYQLDVEVTAGSSVIESSQAEIEGSFLIDRFYPAGDYNLNGSVDAADYTVWKDGFGSTADLDADGNGDGTVDAADYTVWKDHFGESVADAAVHVVPEPGWMGWLLLAVPLLCRPFGPGGIQLPRPVAAPPARVVEGLRP
ncbi:MAG: hypothetical protein KDA99_21645 [Planctomycetales bacterium]|nr:hypothetical protein [Planctomycetales bacterium]